MNIDDIRLVLNYDIYIVLGCTYVLFKAILIMICKKDSLHANIHDEMDKHGLVSNAIKC